MAIKDLINSDLKSAMLSGDKTLVTTLRGLKGVILNAEIAGNKRDTGLDEQSVIALLQKEAKKRQESAELYRQGDRNELAEKEDAEKKLIEKYLPKQLSEDEIKQLVDQEAEKIADLNPQKMGQLIGAVKSASGGAADGSIIARLVKEKIG